MAAPYPTCHLNGELLPLAEARISPLDRGFLFADGVYEVVPVHRGRPFRLREHLRRLDASLAAIRLANPHSPPEWQAILDRVAGAAGAARRGALDRSARRGVRSALRPEATPRAVPGPQRRVRHGRARRRGPRPR